VPRDAATEHFFVSAATEHKRSAGRFELAVYGKLGRSGRPSGLQRLETSNVESQRERPVQQLEHCLTLHIEFAKRLRGVLRTSEVDK
jgi:hypothetical protein